MKAKTTKWLKSFVMQVIPESGHMDEQGGPGWHRGQEKTGWCHTGTLFFFSQ